MEWVAVWLALSFGVGLFAERLGRSGVLAFFVAALLSPVVGLLLYAAAGRSGRARAADIEAEERLRAEVRAKIAQETEDASAAASVAPSAGAEPPVTASARLMRATAARRGWRD